MEERDTDFIEISVRDFETGALKTGENWNM
jgi:hypothetical protein